MVQVNQKYLMIMAFYAFLTFFLGLFFSVSRESGISLTGDSKSDDMIFGFVASFVLWKVFGEKMAYA
jgi:hypothetical protein